MSRNYSSRDFFRQMPNAMLARYFASKSLLDGLDFKAMKEGKPDALLEAWGRLPDEQRSEAEADFREILAMSNRKGYQALLDEARWQLEDQPDELQALLGRLRAWIKRGLPTLDDRRPVLVLGRHLRDFLQARREVNKKTCGPGRLYCVRCREPRRPTGGAVRYEPLTETLGNLVGRCPCCDAGLYRRVSEKSLSRALGDLVVLQGLDPGESHENGERGAKGVEHIDESHPACTNSDFNQDASTHAKSSPR